MTLPVDYGEAMKWFAKAAAEQNEKAMNDIGSLYQDGQGVAPNYAPRTTPLASRPRIAENDNGKSFYLIPERSFQSIGLTLAAAAPINTVLPLICGSGTFSSNFNFSGPPHSRSTTALIAYLHLQVKHALDDALAYRGSHQESGRGLSPDERK